MLAQGLGGRLQLQALDLLAERPHVLEPPINGGEAHVGDLVELLQLAHDQFTHLARGHLALGDLAHVYDGSPKGATATTVPAGLPVRVTYDGWETPPSAAGFYEVVATVVSADFAGSATGTLAILEIIDPFERWLETQSLDPQDTRFVWDEDGDGDGQTTWEEYLADTDPENPDDLFAVEGTYSDENGSIQMTFPASPDRYYQLEYSTNLFTPAQVLDLGWGTDGQFSTNAPGQWFGTIRVRMDPP